jgi:hypothetical protein
VDGRGRDDETDEDDVSDTETHMSGTDTDADNANGDGKMQRKLRRLLSELPLLLDAVDIAYEAESRATGRFHLTLQMAAARKELQESSLFGQFLRWVRSSGQQRKLANAGPFVTALLLRPDASLGVVLSTRAEWLDQGGESSTVQNPLVPAQAGPWRWAQQLDELLVSFGEALRAERRRAAKIRREAVEAEERRRGRRARWRRGQQRELKAKRKGLLMTLNVQLRRKEVAIKRRHQRQLDEERDWRREMESIDRASMRDEADFRQQEAEEAKEARHSERSMRLRATREAEEMQVKDSERSVAVEAAARALRRMRATEARRIDKKAKAVGTGAEGKIELRRLELSLRYDSASSAPGAGMGTAAPGELWAMQEEDWASQDAEVAARKAETQPQEEEEERQRQNALRKARLIRGARRREMGEQRDEQQRKQQVILRRRRQRTEEWRGLRQEQEAALRGNKAWHQCKQRILKRVDALVLVRRAEEQRRRSGGAVLFKDKDFDSEKEREREERVLWARVAKMLDSARYGDGTGARSRKTKRGKGEVQWMRPSELELPSLGLGAELALGLGGLSIPPALTTFAASPKKKRTPKAGGAGAVVLVRAGNTRHDLSHEKQWVCQSFLADRWLVSAIAIVASHDDHTRWLTSRAAGTSSSTVAVGQRHASDDSDEDDEDDGDTGVNDALPLLPVQAGGCRPNLLERLFLSKSVNQCGAYALQLCMPTAGWEHVLLDDRFPCYSHAMASKQGRKANSTTAAAWRPACGYNVSSNVDADGNPLHHFEVLTALLEKAFAKVYGGYPALAGGMVHTALEALTGGVGEELDLGDSDCGLAMLDGSLWHRLVHCHRMGHIICVGRPSSSGGGGGNGAADPDDGEVLQIIRMEQVQTGTVGTLISGWSAGGANVSAAAAAGRAGQTLRLVQLQVPRLRTPGAKGKGSSKRRNNEHEVNWHGLWRQRRRREWDAVARSDELRGAGGVAALRRARAKVENGARTRTTSNHLNKVGENYIKGKWIDKKVKVEEKDESMQADTHTFWLPFEALMAAQQSVFVCRLHRTRREGGLWHKYVATGRWKGLPPVAGGGDELGESGTAAQLHSTRREREREQQQQQQQQWRMLHSPQYRLHVDDTATSVFVKLTLICKEKESVGAGSNADVEGGSTGPGSPSKQASETTAYGLDVAGDNEEDDIGVRMGIFVLDCFGRRARAVVRRHIVAGSIVPSTDSSSADTDDMHPSSAGSDGIDSTAGGRTHNVCAKTMGSRGRQDTEEIFLEIANLPPRKEPYTLLPCTREVVDASFRIEVFTDVPLCMRGSQETAKDWEAKQTEEMPLLELPAPSQYACADVEVDSFDGHGMGLGGQVTGSANDEEEVDEGARAEDVDAWAAEEEAVAKMTKEELLQDSTDEEEEEPGGDEKQEEEEEDQCESDTDSESATGDSEETSDPEAEIAAAASSMKAEQQARQQWEASVKPAGFRPAARGPAVGDGARGPAVGDGASMRTNNPRENEQQQQQQRQDDEEDDEEDDSEDEDLDPEDALLSLAQEAVTILLPQLAPHEEELQQMADVVMDEAMEKFNGEFDEAGYYIQSAINAPTMLGVPGDATTAEAKKRFRKLVLQHHPDKVRTILSVALIRCVQYYRLQLRLTSTDSLTCPPRVVILSNFRHCPRLTKRLGG